MSMQLDLWTGEPIIPGAHLIGKRVLHENGIEMTITGIAAYTEQWGTEYHLTFPGLEPGWKYLAYADEFTIIEDKRTIESPGEA